MVSTIPNRSVNLALWHALRSHGFRGRVALTAHAEGDVRAYGERKVDVVLRPFMAAAEQAALLLADRIRNAGASVPSVTDNTKGLHEHT